MERNLEIIKIADCVIDLGPKGSDGEIVAFGTPDDNVKEKQSYTGQFLKPVLAKKYVALKKRGGGVSEAAE